MKTLKSYEFQESGGGKATYDWDAILSGKIVLLEREKDYTCKDTTMQTLCRSAARRRGMVVKTGKDDAGLVVQAVKATPEQLKAWAEQDAAKESEATEQEAE